jgi:hypothetical protein
VESAALKENLWGKREGKIAFIAGGNSGIGLATAQQCVHEGAYVCISSITGTALFVDGGMAHM